MKKYLTTFTSLSLATVILMGAGCQTTTNNATTGNTTNTANSNVAITDSTATLDNTFELKVDKTVLVTDGDVEVRLTGVTNDSRCPSDVACITAGNVTIALEVAANGESQSTSITGSGSAELPMDATVLGYRVTMLDVTPQPTSGQTIAQTDYVVTLKVSQADTTTVNN